jgi:hypothetical protein
MGQYASGRSTAFLQLKLFIMAVQRFGKTDEGATRFASSAARAVGGVSDAIGLLPCEPAAISASATSFRSERKSDIFRASLLLSDASCSRSSLAVRVEVRIAGRPPIRKERSLTGSG